MTFYLKNVKIKIDGNPLCNTERNINMKAQINLEKRDKELRNKRRKYNNKILKVLQRQIKEDNGTLRFIQILWSLDIISNNDRFYEESDITYNKINTRLEMNNKMKNNIKYNINNTI